MTSRAATITGYLVLALALLLADLSARRDASGQQLTVGSLVRLAMGQRSAQLALLLTWWWLGWHFLLAL